MAKGVVSQTKNYKKETSGFSNDSDGAMFESRPFVVQSKAEKQSKQPNLKVSLLRSEHYGHHLSQMEPAGASVSKAVQTKMGMKLPAQSKPIKGEQLQLPKSEQAKRDYQREETMPVQRMDAEDPMNQMSVYLHQGVSDFERYKRNQQFGGSNVLNFGYSQGADHIRVMMNGGTGYRKPLGQNYVNERMQGTYPRPPAINGIVAAWQPPQRLTAQGYQPLSMTYPSNTLANVFTPLNLQKPSVMKNNVHAEMNDLLQHKQFAQNNYITMSNLKLAQASDIPHCAECFFANKQSLGNNFYSQVGTDNKLFKNWAPPHSGFYGQAINAPEINDYSPFRLSDGNLKPGLNVGFNQGYILNSYLPPDQNLYRNRSMSPVDNSNSSGNRTSIGRKRRRGL